MPQKIIPVGYYLGATLNVTAHNEYRCKKDTFDQIFNINRVKDRVKTLSLFKYLINTLNLIHCTLPSQLYPNIILKICGDVQ